jgi:glycosyltransferase involved in cell wall biosynthesis
MVRAGQQWTVHWAAFLHYRHRLSGTFDVVLDEVNTIPFFTPLWSDIPSVMFIHQLAREVWWYESPFPLNAVGFIAEPRYLRFYRRVPVLTVSESTKRDLERLGFTGHITVIPEGLESILVTSSTATTEPTFLYVGRLAPSKRINQMLRALALFRQTTGTGTLWLVGTGSARYKKALIKLAGRLAIAPNVVFWGRVDAAQKHQLMASAHAVLMTSVREGWGLVVSEAGACGTPAIVYDVPGLRDSVRNESTGLIVQPDPASLSSAMKRLASDPALRARLGNASQAWSLTLSFDDAATAVARTLEAALTA